ncbi:MAG: hypothetical protein EXR74_09545 [Bdellovibrionales bacterium]|nr:hypothetical protein [Bdellovibrionales bacterium]
MSNPKYNQIALGIVGLSLFFFQSASRAITFNTEKRDLKVISTVVAKNSVLDPSSSQLQEWLNQQFVSTKLFSVSNFEGFLPSRRAEDILAVHRELKSDLFAFVVLSPQSVGVFLFDSDYPKSFISASELLDNHNPLKSDAVLAVLSRAFNKVQTAFFENKYEPLKKQNPILVIEETPYSSPEMPLAVAAPLAIAGVGSSFAADTTTDISGEIAHTGGGVVTQVKEIASRPLTDPFIIPEVRPVSQLKNVLSDYLKNRKRNHSLKN